MRKIPEHFVWRAPLAGMQKALRERADRSAGAWVWYALPRGLVVAMRTHETTECSHVDVQLRLSRAQVPGNEEAFDQEAAVLLRHFGGVDAWEPMPIDHRRNERGGVRRMFRAVPKESAAVPKCARCDRPAVDPGVYTEDLCNACALELGNEEIGRRRE